MHLNPFRRRRLAEDADKVRALEQLQVNALRIQRLREEAAVITIDLPRRKRARPRSENTAR